MAAVTTTRQTFTDAEKDEWRTETGNRKEYALTFTDGTTLTGTNVTGGGFDLTESLCSGDSLDFSCVEVPQISFTLLNLDNEISDMKGKQFSLTATTAAGTMPIGTWIIQDANYTNDGRYDIKAYGLMSKFYADVTDWWVNKVTVPITLRDLLISLCDVLGVDYNIPETFCNSTMSITQKGVTGTDGAMSGAAMLGYIQEAAGQFFTMPRTCGNGTVLTSIDLAASTTDAETYTGTLHTGDVDLNDYTTQKIDKVQIRSTDKDVGGIAGTGTNAYVIQANPLFYIFGADDLAKYAANVLQQISSIQYTPVTANVKGLPYVEPGDRIKITTPDDHACETLVLQREMSGAQDYTDVITAKGSQNRETVTARNGSLKVLNQKMHEIVNNVETLSSTITEVQEGVQTNTSKIEQTANKIDIAVAQNGYSNLLLNSNFTDPNGYFTYWKTYNMGSTTTEYIGDSDFPDGHALKITKSGTTDDPVFQDVNYDANINGKYVNLYLSAKILDAGTQGTNLRVGFYVKFEDGTYKYPAYTTSLTIGKYARCRFAYQVTEDQKVVQIAPRIFVAEVAKTQTVEINNVMLFVSTDKLPAPFGTWTDKNNNDLISQINLAPEGVKISGSKVNIEAPEFMFGKDPSTVTMKTNTSSTGVSFEGSGTIDFKTKGRYTAINLNADSGASGSQISMYNSGTQNTLSIDNFNGSKTGNQLQLVGGDSSWGNYMRLTNNDYSSGRWANTLYWFSNTGSYNSFYLENYEANSNQKIANRLLLSSSSSANSLTLQNYQHGTGSVVNSQITMNDSITYECQNWHNFTFKGNDRQFRISGATHVYINGVDILSKLGITAM